MATSSNFFDDKQNSLADFLPENGNENKNNQEGKPKPTERKQYSYCSNDDKSTNFQSTGKLIGPKVQRLDDVIQLARFHGKLIFPRFFLYFVLLFCGKPQCSGKFSVTKPLL